MRACGKVAFFRVVLAAVSIGTTSAMAQTTLAVGNAPGFPGQATVVPIAVSHATNLVAAQFDVRYSTGTVAIIVPTQQRLSSGQIIRSRELSPGVRRIVTYSLSKLLVTNRAVIAQLPFTVSPAIRDSSGPITPSSAVLLDQRNESPSEVRLQSGAIFVRPAFVNSEGAAQFFFSSVPGETYRIEATTDFIRWTPISTNVAASSFLDLVDVDARNYPSRFYRTASISETVRFESAVRLPDGRLRLRVSGPSGQGCTVESSTDLKTWQHESTLMFGPEGVAEETLQSIRPARFFRLVSSARP